MLSAVLLTALRGAGVTPRVTSSQHPLSLFLFDSLSLTPGSPAQHCIFQPSLQLGVAK